MYDLTLFTESENFENEIVMEMCRLDEDTHYLYEESDWKGRIIEFIHSIFDKIREFIINLFVNIDEIVDTKRKILKDSKKAKINDKLLHATDLALSKCGSEIKVIGNNMKAISKAVGRYSSEEEFKKDLEYDLKNAGICEFDSRIIGPIIAITKDKTFIEDFKDRGAGSADKVLESVKKDLKRIKDQAGSLKNTRDSLIADARKAENKVELSRIRQVCAACSKAWKEIMRHVKTLCLYKIKSIAVAK